MQRLVVFNLSKVVPDVDQQHLARNHHRFVWCDVSGLIRRRDRCAICVAFVAALGLYITPVSDHLGR